MNEQRQKQLAHLYRQTLLTDVIPFWLTHGMDRKHGGIISALDRDGTVVDTDKSVWVQGRAGWLFATLYNTVEKRAEWLAASRSCVKFLRRHCHGPDGKMYFLVTRDGQPVRMRRYAYSETFATIANAAFAKATGDARAANDAAKYFATFVNYNFTPGRIAPKYDPHTRPLMGFGPYMIGIITAQELRTNLGDIQVAGRTCTEWIDHYIAAIERHFLKPRHKAVMEVVGANGEVVDHFDGRTLNPGHAIEGAWFIMHEGQWRGDRQLIRVGQTMLDWMWARGWDRKYGGIFYFRDLHGRPVQEYWQDMKFWWPHCEAMVATLLAYRLTGQAKYARWHQMVHDWSFQHFPDRKYGEWYGYLHRDGRLSVPLKGNWWKGPFHLPRTLWYCWQLLEQPPRRPRN